MANRERVGVDIDVTAFDNASKVLRAIEQNLQRLQRNAQATAQAMQKAVPFAAPPVGGLGAPHAQRFARTVQQAQARSWWGTIAPFGMPATTMPFTEAMNTRLFRFGERLRSVVDRVSEGYRNLSQNSEKTAKSIHKVARGFRRAANTMLWGALGVLGVTWSIQGVLSQSIQPLMKYVNLMTNWADAAFSVATWLAIAARQGFDVGEWLGGKEATDVIKEIVENGLFLQSTIGSLQDAILIFMNNVLNYSEQAEGGILSVKDAISALMDKIMEFVNNPEVIAVFGRFAIGVAEGAGKALDVIQENIGGFENMLGGLMNFIETMLGVAVTVPNIMSGASEAIGALSKSLEDLGIGVVGAPLRKVAEMFSGFKVATEPVNALLKALSEAKTPSEKFGIFIGGLATFEPIITPILSFIQVILTLSQIIVFGISVMIDLLAVGTAMLPLLDKIAAAAVVIAGIAAVPKMFERGKEFAKDLFTNPRDFLKNYLFYATNPAFNIPYNLGMLSKIYEAWTEGRIREHACPVSNVNQTMYVNIGSVHHDVDVNKLLDKMSKVAQNETVRTWR